MTTTNVFLSLRRELRLARLRSLDALDAVLRRRAPMTPPRVQIDAIGGGDFHGIGRHLAMIATTLGELTPHGRILDIGCGVGRLAVPLTSYLTTGEYSGFDVSARAVSWCRTQVSALHPNFWFNHIDLANSSYNPHGSIRPEHFSFPCADASVDLVFASSVFTHLLPATADRYVAETARVLKPGRSAVLSFFLLDSAIRSRLGTLVPTFRYFPEAYYALANETEPEAAVAYDVDAVLKALSRRGLQPVWVKRGGWSGHPDPLSYQDFVVVRRAAA